MVMEDKLPDTREAVRSLYAVEFRCMKYAGPKVTVSLRPVVTIFEWSLRIREMELQVTANALQTERYIDWKKVMILDIGIQRQEF